MSFGLGGSSVQLWLGQLRIEQPGSDLQQSIHAPLVLRIYIALLAMGLLLDVIWGWRELRAGAVTQEGFRWRSTPWGVLQVAQVALILVLCSVVGGVLFAWLSQSDRWAPPVTQAVGIILQSLVFHWVGLLLIVALLRRTRTGWGAAFGLQARAFGRGLRGGVGWYLGALPVIWGYSLVWQALLRNYDVEFAVQDVLWIISSDSPWGLRLYLFVLAALVAPVMEELLFRGLALPAIARRLGMPTAVIIVSLVFATVHWHVPSFAALFVVGLTLALAYWRSGTLWTPIFIHGLFNGINLGLMIWLRKG